MFGLLAMVAAAVSPVSWATYTNVRFGFSPCYPKTWKPGHEAANGDGKQISESSGGLVWISGSNNLDQKTARAEAFEQVPRNSVISYRNAKKDWAVTSGASAASIFYTRVIQRGDQLLIFRAEYPKSAAAAYNPLIAKMSRCFRAGTPAF